MGSLLRLRPTSVVHRLAPRNEACPLSLRELARGLGRGRPAVVVAAPHVAVDRKSVV